MKTDPAGDGSIYKAMRRIDRSFKRVLREIERVRQVRWLGKRALLDPVELALKETRAWTMFEILEVLHEREENEWIRLGRARIRQLRKTTKSPGKRA